MSANNNPIITVSFIKSSQAASVTNANEICLWDLASSQNIFDKPLQLNTDSLIKDIIFIDERIIIVQFYNQIYCIIDIENKIAESYDSLAFLNYDAKSYTFAGCSDGSISIIDNNQNNNKLILKQGTSHVSALAVHDSNHTSFLAAGFIDGSCYLSLLAHPLGFDEFLIFMKLATGKELPYSNYDQEIIQKLVTKQYFNREKFLEDYGQQLSQYTISIEPIQCEKENYYEKHNQ